jgi:hypothetical protein
VTFGLGPKDVLLELIQADDAVGRFDAHAHLVAVVGARDGDACRPEPTCVRRISFSTAIRSCQGVVCGPVNRALVGPTCRG